MFDKSFLVGKVVNSLQKEGYEVLQTEGNFDFVAKRDKHTLIVKVLMNIDALKEDQAMSLRAVAYFMNCQPVVVATKNNRETLDDDVVYARFDIPVMTPNLLESIAARGEVSAIQSAKGRHTMEVDTDAIRARRKEMGLTLEGLAAKIGVSKKAVYEIENRRVNPTKETVEKLEDALSRGIQKPYEIKSAPITYLKPRSGSQEKVSKEFTRMGIDNSSVYSPHLSNVGREKFSIITSLSQNVEKIRKQALTIRKLSDIFSSKAVVVATRKSAKESVGGVPVMLESELPEIESSKDLKKRIEEKE